MKRGIDVPGVCVVFYCNDGKGNFVMGKRSKNTRDEHGRWDLGGGAVELGETAEDAVRREVKEEYNTDVLAIEFLGYRDVHRTDHNGKNTHWVALDFKVFVDEKKVKNSSLGGHDEIGWFRLDNIPKPAHSQLPIFFKKYKKKLVSLSKKRY